MSFNLFKILYIYGKFQCISLINFSFDDALFVNFYFDIFFKSTFFISLCHNHNVVISKINYEFLIFKKLFKNCMIILIKIYDNMNN
jgi:hypothetical protein